MSFLASVQSLDRLHHLLLLAVFALLVFAAAPALFWPHRATRDECRPLCRKMARKAPPIVKPALPGTLSAFNYADRSIVPHAAVMSSHFAKEATTLRRFNHTFVTDWLGTKTPFYWDCEYDSPYKTGHISRVVPCRHHSLLVASNFTGLYYPLTPTIEEEYLEWVALLTSAAHFHDFCPQDEEYVAAELGARYG